MTNGDPASRDGNAPSQGERAARRRKARALTPWYVREWPILAVLGLVAISLGVVAANHFRRGTVLLALSVLAGGLLRLVLPNGRAGALAVRSKVIDVLTVGFFGGGLLILALIVPPPT